MDQSRELLLKDVRVLRVDGVVNESFRLTSWATIFCTLSVKVILLVFNLMARSALGSAVSNLMYFIKQSEFQR